MVNLKAHPQSQQTLCFSFLRDLFKILDYGLSPSKKHHNLQKKKTNYHELSVFLHFHFWN